VQISHFTDLKVYQRAADLAAAIFTISKRWPAEERYSLTDQIRRATRSTGASISEAWGKRRYEAHFVSKLTDADAENHEVEHWLLTAKRDGYLTDAELTTLLEQKREVGRMLGTMLHNPTLFILK
jgi:four helix bundle protein